MTRFKKKYPWLLSLIVLLGGVSSAVAGPEKLKRKMAPQKGPTEPVPFILTPEEEKQRHYMVEISRQLGVTCTHCHDVKNFRSEEIKEWKVAKKHIDFVKKSNAESQALLGPKMDCFMCHRGEAKPDYKEPLELVD